MSVIIVPGNLLTYEHSKEVPENDTKTANQIRAEVQKALADHPKVIATVLEQMVASTLLDTENHSSNLMSTSDNSSIAEVTQTELEPLVAICKLHQTVQARIGVQNYKAPMARKQWPIRKPDNAPKELSQEQLLAQHINSVIHRAQDCGSITGLNRKEQWKGKNTVQP